MIARTRGWHHMLIIIALKTIIVHDTEVQNELIISSLQ